MGSVNYFDYRAMLGKYNLGSVVLNEKGDALELVNNHKYAIWKNGVTIDPEANNRVRNDFCRAIEEYVSSCGFKKDDGQVKSFLDEVSRDLKGANGKGDLTRSGDLARIIDKVDAAILSGDFSLEQPAPAEPNAQAPGQPADHKPLSRRFVMAANKVNMNPGQDVEDKGGRNVDYRDYTLACVRECLDPGKGHNKTLVNYLTDRLGISKDQVLTYLETRPESLMALVRKTLNSERFLQQVAADKETFKTAAANGRLAQALICVAMQEIHGEKPSDCAIRDMKGTEKEVFHILSGLSGVPLRTLLSKGEFVPFLRALNAISDPKTTGRFAFTMLGCKVSVGRTPDGVAYCRMGNAGFKLRSQDMAWLKGNLIGQLAHEKGLQVKDLKSLCSKDFLEDEAFVELRTGVLQTVISVHTGLKLLSLQNLSHKELNKFATQIIDGNPPPDLKEQIERGCVRMYSPAMIDTIDTYEKSVELQKSVSFKNPIEKPVGLGSLVSDMFLNANVWKMDTVGDLGGQLVESLADNLAALKELRDGNVEDLVKTLPPIGDQTESLKSLLVKLKDVLATANLDDEQEFRTFCTGNDCKPKPVFSEMVNTLDEIAAKAVEHYQKVFSSELNAKTEVKEDGRSVTSKTLGELLREQQSGTKSPEAKFMRKLLNKYLGETEPKVKRAMMASLFRAPGGAGLDDAHQLGALFKGAGPIFQKFLQGLPMTALPEKMRAVVADMKTNLAPIPEKVVLAQLAQAVKESDGAIKGIVVEKTLGSASVGQAFLCTLTDGEGKARQCVIKMLKPDVQNSYSREIAIVNRLTDEIDKESGTPGAMKETLRARLDSIQTELDLTAEGKQVEAGQVYNCESDMKAKARNADLVVGMKLVDGIKTKTNIIALELADGETLDKSIGAANDLLRDFAEKTDFRLMNGQLYRWKGDGASYLEMKEKLVETSKALAQKQKLMVACAQKWFNEAIYGSGFVHGDVHAGNVVLADNGDKITIIDYGNAFKLETAEQKALQDMIASAAFGDADRFVEKLFGVIAGDPKLNQPKVTLQVVKDDDRLMKDLRDVFVKGDDSAVVDRMTVAIGMLRQRGVAVPGAIYNFLEGLQRVKNAVADVTDAYEDVCSKISGFVPDDKYFNNEDGTNTEEAKMIENRGKKGWGHVLLPFGKMLNSALLAGPGSQQLFRDLNSELYEKFCGKGGPLDDLVKAAKERLLKVDKSDENVVDDSVQKRLKVAYEVVSGFMRGEDKKAELKKNYDNWLKDPGNEESLEALVRNLISAQQELMKAFYHVPEEEDLCSFGEAAGDVVYDSMSDENGEISAKKGTQTLWDYGFKAVYRMMYNADSKKGRGVIPSQQDRCSKIFGTEGSDVGNFYLEFKFKRTERDSKDPSQVRETNDRRQCNLDDVEKSALPMIRKRGTNMSFSGKVVNALYASAVGGWHPFNLSNREQLEPVPIKDKEVMESFVSEVGDNMAHFLLEDMMAGKDDFRCYVESLNLEKIKIETKHIEEFTSHIVGGIQGVMIQRCLFPLVYRGEIQANKFFNGLRNNKEFADLVTEDKIKTMVQDLMKNHLTDEMKEKLVKNFRASYEVEGVDDGAIKNMFETMFASLLLPILGLSFSYVSEGINGYGKQVDNWEELES